MDGILRKLTTQTQSFHSASNSHQLAVSRPRCLYHRSEDRSRPFILIHRALRVPLHGYNEMVAAGTLQRLDDSILGTPSHDAQPFARNFRCLMMT